MIDIRGVCTLLQVFDLERSIQFYGDLLGFRIKSRAEHWAWLEREETELMLNTAYDPEEQPARPDPERVRAHGDTCLYFGCPDVDAAYEHFVARGLALEPPKVTHYGMKQLYVTDPDGFALCFQWSA